ncbi:MAG: ClbS/DfsB family four-helix bundle protein [Eubacterium sp.]|nr:ClbS/DfsB family four-helix bundle protein [Eubacterium sp.]
MLPFLFRSIILLLYYILRKKSNIFPVQFLYLLEKSHRNEELFSKGGYLWAGNNALGSYFASTPSNHYYWLTKKYCIIGPTSSFLCIIK